MCRVGDINAWHDTATCSRPSQHHQQQFHSFLPESYNQPVQKEMAVVVVTSSLPSIRPASPHTEPPRLLGERNMTGPVHKNCPSRKEAYIVSALWPRESIMYTPHHHLLYRNERQDGVLESVSIFAGGATTVVVFVCKNVCHFWHSSPGTQQPAKANQSASIHPTNTQLYCCFCCCCCQSYRYSLSSCSYSINDHFKLLPTFYFLQSQDILIEFTIIVIIIITFIMFSIHSLSSAAIIIAIAVLCSIPCTSKDVHYICTYNRIQFLRNYYKNCQFIIITYSATVASKRTCDAILMSSVMYARNSQKLLSIKF